MHDPEIVVFDIKIPLLRRDTFRLKAETERWTLSRRRRTNAENLGEPICPWYRPAGYRIAVAGRRYQWRTLATVWHNEPDGHDSGTICKGMKGSDASPHNLVWALRHWRHLSVHVHPYQRIDRWLRSRCAECGRRFFWKDARFGYMSSDAVYHDQCMSLRHTRSQLDDPTAYVRGNADENQRWRATHRLDQMLDLMFEETNDA